MPRPPRGPSPRIVIVLSSPLLLALERAARREGLSPGAIVRRALGTELGVDPRLPPDGRGRRKGPRNVTQPSP